MAEELKVNKRNVVHVSCCFLLFLLLVVVVHVSLLVVVHVSLLVVVVAGCGLFSMIGERMFEYFSKPLG